MLMLPPWAELAQMENWTARETAQYKAMSAATIGSQIMQSTSPLKLKLS